MNHAAPHVGLGGQQQQPQFSMASAAFFGHFPATMGQPTSGFVTSTPVSNNNPGLNLCTSSSSSASSSGLNSSSSPEDGKGEKMSRSSQYKKVIFLIIIFVLGQSRYFTLIIIRREVYAYCLKVHFFKENS